MYIIYIAYSYKYVKLETISIAHQTSWNHPEIALAEHFSLPGQRFTEMCVARLVTKMSQPQDRPSIWSMNSRTRRKHISSSRHHFSPWKEKNLKCCGEFSHLWRIILWQWKQYPMENNGKSYGNGKSWKHTVPHKLDDVPIKQNHSRVGIFQPCWTRPEGTPVHPHIFTWILNQWPFQVPIYWRYLPYIKVKGISPQNMALYGTVPQF